MLVWRLTLGPLLIAALAGLCWLDLGAARPGAYLLPLAAVLALAVAGELLAMFRIRSRVSPRPGDASLGETGPQPWAVYGGTLLAVLGAGGSVLFPSHAAVLGPLGGLALGLVAGLLLAVIGELARYRGPGQVTTNLALSTFAVLYAGGLMSFLVALRLVGGGQWGMVALVSLVAVVKLSDIGQYTAGRLFGRHKLAPVISPGKTWEGAIGGLVGALAGAWLTVWLVRELTTTDSFASHTRSIVALVVYAIVVAIVGILGDLAESLIKRDAGVKDSSSWLPGFGGVMDLLDSLLLAAPVAYAFWAIGLVSS